MPSEMNPILSKQQLQHINRTLSAVDGAIAECDVAESCGVDCADKRSQLEDIRQRAMAFKNTYFPNAK